MEFVEFVMVSEAGGFLLGLWSALMIIVFGFMLMKTFALQGSGAFKYGHFSTIPSGKWKLGSLEENRENLKMMWYASLFNAIIFCNVYSFLEAVPWWFGFVLLSTPILFLVACHILGLAFHKVLFYVFKITEGSFDILFRALERILTKFTKSLKNGDATP